VAVAKNVKLGVTGQRAVAPYRTKQLKTAEQIQSKYFLRLHVADKAGVLAKITQSFADHEVSLGSVLQQPLDDAGAEIIIITHDASKANMQKVLDHLKSMDFLKAIESYYRVEG
jgi:homoserine dehydrogenase